MNLCASLKREVRHAGFGQACLDHLSREIPDRRRIRQRWLDVFPRMLLSYFHGSGKSDLATFPICLGEVIATEMKFCRGGSIEVCRERLLGKGEPILELAARNGLGVRASSENERFPTTTSTLFSPRYHTE
ncbi:hypothetical protein E1B28_003635 [Marasmius oreades]|uniref:Uncharacterized protein n=1 Tax=Marasmius oreades TaxID=181124 RepID=A0A9P7UX23_9AGAR|nr:uncharacterized protein E1B28_003635 [Marasmius oreades]KAG7096185.1 hypothetical protein E1B28_003635 [Marasmius oreades]